jgi:diguanylate cyclase
MDLHHVSEAAGIVIIGLVVYSYICRWFEPAGPWPRRWRVVATGFVFGAQSVALIIARIQVGEGEFVDARAVPLALIGLFEGGPTVAIAAGLAIAYRMSRGGGGMIAGVLGIIGTALAAWLIRRWALRHGRIGMRHALVLAVIVYGVTFASFIVLGERGWRLFAPIWFEVLMVNVIGIGLISRLFAEVVASEAGEVARREAAELRATTLLARAAAHEINNPLNIVMGGLAIVGRRLAPGTEDADWIARATAGAQQIKEIVARMNRITEVRTTEGQGTAPPMLDVRKSSSEKATG